jgi:hypothetical protein
MAKGYGGIPVFFFLFLCTSVLAVAGLLETANLAAVEDLWEVSLVVEDADIRNRGARGW